MFMDANTDFGGKLKSYIDNADGLTARNILEMLEINQGSLWFASEAAGDVSDNIDMFGNDEEQLTFEQVKELYPQWFAE